MCDRRPVKSSLRAQTNVNCHICKSTAKLPSTPVNHAVGAPRVPDIMMWVTVLGCLVVIVLLALATAVLIKYLFFR